MRRLWPTVRLLEESIPARLIFWHTHARRKRRSRPDATICVFTGDQHQVNDRVALRASVSPASAPFCLNITRAAAKIVVTTMNTATVIAKGDRPEANPDRGRIAQRVTGPALFVLVLWVAMTAAGGWLIAEYGRNCPWYDGWDTALYLQRWPPPLSHLLQRHNEHRIVLPRLVLIFLTKQARDFRAGCWLSLAILSGAALGLAALAKSVRGRWSAADAFFPLALLSWAHTENLLQEWQLQYTLAIGLFALFLAFVVRGDRRPLETTAAGLSLIGLTLCGANGVILAVPLTAWLLVVGLKTRNRSAACWASVTIPLLVWACPASTAPNPVSGHGALDRVETIFACLGLSIGPRFSRWFSEGPWILAAQETAVRGHVVRLWPEWSVLAVALFGGAMLVCMRWLRRDWPRASGMTAALIAGCLVVAAVGWNRELSFEVHTLPRNEVPAQPCVRYALLFCPATIAAYFAFILYGGQWARRFVPAFLAGAVAIGCVAYVPFALEWATPRAVIIDGFLRDVRRGVSTAALIKRHGAALGADSDAARHTLTVEINALRWCGHPSFRQTPSGRR